MRRDLACTLLSVLFIQTAWAEESDRGTHGDRSKKRHERQMERQDGGDTHYFNNGIPLVNDGEGDLAPVVPGQPIDDDLDGEIDRYAEDVDGDGIDDIFDGDLHGAGGVGGPDGVLDSEEGQDAVHEDGPDPECNVCDLPDSGDGENINSPDGPDTGGGDDSD